MTKLVHKRLIDEQVKMILDRIIRKELSSEQAMELLGLKRSQFFEFVKRGRERKEGFSIQYHRGGKSRGIRPAVERKILQELKVEKTLIEDPALPVRFYNYSYYRDQLSRKYEYQVSPPTIIDRAPVPRPESWLRKRVFWLGFISARMISGDIRQHLPPEPVG